MPSSKRTTSVSAHRAPRRGHLGLGDALPRRGGTSAVGAQVHLVLLAALVVVRDLRARRRARSASRRCPGRGRRGRRPWRGRCAPPARACRRRGSCRRRRRPGCACSCRQQHVGVLRELVEVGPADPELDLRVVAGAEGGHRLHLRAQVERARTAAGSRCGPASMIANWLVLALARPARASRRSSRGSSVFCGSAPIVRSVYSTAGELAHARRDRVEDRLRGLEARALGGADVAPRTATRRRAGRKFLLATMPSGIVGRNDQRP